MGCSQELYERQLHKWQGKASPLCSVSPPFFLSICLPENLSSGPREARQPKMCGLRPSLGPSASLFSSRCFLSDPATRNLPACKWKG